MNKEEAIERVKARFDKWALDEEDLAALQALGLVTKVSEDERIRQEIHAYLFNTLHNTHQLTPRTNEFERWLAYLEKQKEQKPVISDEAIRDGVVHFGITQYQIDYWLKKHINVVEQKPAEWSEEDDQYLLVCKNALQKYQSSDKWDANIIYSWLEKRLKSLRRQPAEWSEEDEKMLKEIIDYMMPMPIFFESTTGQSGKEFTREFIEKAITWLNSIRPQPHWKQSLATADLENDLCDIQDNYPDCSHEYKVLGEAIEFIRSTESHWKPSKEQMKALNDVANEGVLLDLFNDLLKLF